MSGKQSFRATKGASQPGEPSPAVETSRPVEAAASAPLACGALLPKYAEIRRATEALAAPLSPEDQGLQSMEQASPTKWHLAHVTWYFETFILAGTEGETGGTYEPFHPEFTFLFNSYYNSVGPMHARPERGMLSRPSASEVLAYREAGDEAIHHLLTSGRLDDDEERRGLLELGLHHEQQHQELILTDIKHALSANPMLPAYSQPRPLANPPGLEPHEWVAHGEGLAWTGHAGERFAFDNERPHHRVHLEPHALGSRPISCGEYLEFIEDGAYDRPELWLSEGWERIREAGWLAPGYWFRAQRDEPWQVQTLHGPRAVFEGEPVTHVSFYEADAFARWAGCRLPTEAEWETAATGREIAGNFVESGYLHPRAAASSGEGEQQLYGDVWEWTASPYVAYPGYQAPEGPVGEYNGKFMCNQLVLRGGSCATPRSHIRPSYRNFFPAETRWQFSGIRLAKDLR